MNIRNLIIVALAVILLSSIAGGMFAFKVEQETLLLLREQYEAAFSAAAHNDIPAARQYLQEAQQQNFRYARIIDAHTHYIKLSVLLLLAAFLLPVCRPGGKIRTLVSASFFAGIALFPTSVYLQTLKPGMIYQGSAAVGALLIIAATTYIVISLFQNN